MSFYDDLNDPNLNYTNVISRAGPLKIWMESYRKSEKRNFVSSYIFFHLFEQF